MTATNLYRHAITVRMLHSWPPVALRRTGCIRGAGCNLGSAPVGDQGAERLRPITVEVNDDSIEVDGNRWKLFGASIEADATSMEAKILPYMTKVHGRPLKS